MMSRLSPDIAATGSRLGAALVLAAVSLVIPAPVEGASPSKEEIETFRRHLANGAEHFKKERYFEALAAFRKAREIATPPSLRYKIARTYQEIGRCDRARKLYRQFVDAEIPEQKKTKGRRRLKQLDSKCPRRGTLRIECTPSKAAATVRVAGHTKKCPTRVALEGGSHEVSVESEAHPSATQSVEVTPGERTTTTVELGGSRAGRASDTGGGSKPGIPVRRYAQFGGLAAGLGLLTGAVVTDLSAVGRLEEMRRAERNGNRDRFRQLQDEAEGAKLRAAILYAAGGALTLGSGTWLTVDLVTDSPSNRTTAGLALHPNGIVGFVRW